MTYKGGLIAYSMRKARVTIVGGSCVSHESLIRDQVSSLHNLGKPAYRMSFLTSASV
jgi:hypothetical protein